jgi:glycogen phosphorylase
VETPILRNTETDETGLTERETRLAGQLRDLAGNLWWSWQPEIRALFRGLAPDVWRQAYQNPVAMLHSLPPEDLLRRVDDLEIESSIHRLHRQLGEYLKAKHTWGLHHAGPLAARPVAYFSAEFGLHHSIPIYSGGLGVLAGDHLKSMSDLGVPVVGVGILYHQGYVHQDVDAHGRQQDRFEPISDEVLPIRRAHTPDGTPAHVELELPDGHVQLRLWWIDVGRSRLLLMDGRDDPESGQRPQRGLDRQPEPVPVPGQGEELTGRLYGGDQRTRIRQELVLGVGGWRALRAVGITPSVLHLNEGHSAFALVERAAELVEDQGLPLTEALRKVAASSVFTTHTPVEAGHDRFPEDLTFEHLTPLAERLGMDVGELVDLGREQAGSGAFCPTVLALRLTGHANGVSALHGRVSRRMWQHLYPGKEEREVPIGHITNGIHVSTFLAGDMDDLLSRYLGPDWREGVSKPSVWARAADIPPAELWEVHQVLKARTIAFVRRVQEARREREGMEPPARPELDPHALTIGFARRFATYKRAALLLSDGDRLARLVGDRERPIQFVFAGKAHPQDEGGKELVRRVSELEGHPLFAGRVVFVENYSLYVARQLVQGVDVWLNNPRRPLEACGTSGQKCIFNGVLNLSILDGWWAEGFDGANGFAIGDGEVHGDPDEQDRRDAEALFRTLEEEVIPLYYDRDELDVPQHWMERVLRAMTNLAPRFNADRMVMDYVNHSYLPAAAGETCRMPAG